MEYGGALGDLPWVLDLSDERCATVSLSGGKGASLAVMMAGELPVPPGFVITSGAFAAAVDEAELRASMRANDIERARTLVSAARPPREAIADAYHCLPGPVAVRSSACAEDSRAASYAGQQETLLGVADLAGVLDGVVTCWLSFFADRAAFYRREKGSLDDIAMAVVVQQMVDAQKSGVMFTADPVHGRRDRMVVEAARGLGEAVVSGEVTPDNYVLDRAGTVKRHRVTGEQVLDDTECATLAAYGRRLADLHGGPQDIEWAIDGAGRLFLLQSRPITTI